ncbi:Uu.00g030390.m01.CDS01 [Anthostomella pinea]|uniref:Uu.00g030390.m01.CDS01 n=1 Tax=Anthostomella pinea TaxID=933095 RepID=A0AAI8V9B1_9PEZI|nr:Uu.00g030390.m01.CDS01 [Anthostomella pinea]
MADYSKIFSSKTFKFDVGPQKKEFVLHEAALSTLSKPLDRLLNGSMKEAKEGCVVWDDLDESTFLRFIKWAYSGDYGTPSPDILLDASQIATQHRASGATTNTTDNNCVSLGSLALTEATTTDTSGPCKRESGKAFLENKQYSPPTPTSTPRTNAEACEDYSGIFLAHARLYVLADKYDIRTLRQLALHKLWATLKDFTLYPGRVSDIAALIMYAFQAFSASAVDDVMCGMLADYAACIFEELVECKEWKDMIVELPVFVGCMLTKLAKRLD